MQSDTSFHALIIAAQGPYLSYPFSPQMNRLPDFGTAVMYEQVDRLAEMPVKNILSYPAALSSGPKSPPELGSPHVLVSEDFITTIYLEAMEVGVPSNKTRYETKHIIWT